MKYHQAVHMPRKREISPHMQKLINKANNFMLGNNFNLR